MLTKEGHTVIVVGNLTRDPELRSLPSGDPVCNFGLASNAKWTGQDGKQHERVIWWRIAAYRGLADNCAKYLSKGRLVLVEGRLRPDDNGNPRVWIGNDGEPRASFEIEADGVRFLGGRGETGGDFARAQEPPDEDDVEIPF